MGFVNEGNYQEVLEYHPIDQTQEAQINAVRGATKTLVRTILASVPDCADRSAALRKVREAMHDATGAIALKGLI